MKTAADLFSFLDTHGIAHRTLTHEAIFRVGEGEEIKAQLPGAHTKNLFLKDARDQLWLISALGETRIDLKALPRAIGSGRLSFGNEAPMKRTLGVTPGSVTAFGLINDEQREIRFVLDKALADAELVNFHPLTNTATTAVSQAGLRAFLRALEIEPMIVDFETLTVVNG